MSFFADSAALLAVRPAPVILLVLLVAGGCSTTAPRPYGVPNTPSAAPSSSSSMSAQLESRLRRASASWMGTPHLWGGTNHNGVDCSALVQQIYREALGISVPRTTKDQVRIGSAVKRPQIQTGDLIFFRHDRDKRHVGIYLGNNEFVHASSSRGVMISQIDEPYWRKVYWTTRRVVDPVVSAPTPTAYTPPETARDRKGW